MGRSRLTTIVLVAMLVLGVCLLLYPVVSDCWNRTRQSYAVAAYVEAAEELDTSQQESMLAEARDYNADLVEWGFGRMPNTEMLKRYSSLLDVAGTGVMGYVKIPSLGCSLPIYHGTDESVLQVAIGHLEWTSLPVGGKGTHCAISGHRGLPSAELFTDLDQMVEGDFFELHVLGKTLVYEVDQICIVEPDDVASLHVEPEQDLCTLVTCTPYGINTHRLLVRGHRIDPADYATVTANAVRVDPMVAASVAAAPVVVLATAVLFAYGMRKRKRTTSKVEAHEERVEI